MDVGGGGLIQGFAAAISLLRIKSHCVIMYRLHHQVKVSGEPKSCRNQTE